MELCYFALAHKTRHPYAEVEFEDLREFWRGDIRRVVVTRWEVLYQKAMIETDRTMLRTRIDAAERALNLWELWEDRLSSPQEQLAIGEARMSLELLRCAPKKPLGCYVSAPAASRITGQDLRATVIYCISKS